MKRADEVIIAGAGPVGFVTALGLARAGAKVTIIEAEDKIIDSPRAAVYFPVTLELLDKLGIIDDAHAAGIKNDILEFKYRDLGKSVILTPREVIKDVTKYPYQLHFGQNVLAEIVKKHLLELPGTEVRFNTRLTGLAQDGNGVTATVATAQGDETIRGGWLIGCDGARSSVRKLLNLSFDGHTWPDRFMANNIYYDEFLENGFSPANFYIHPQLWAVIALIGRDNLWRVTFNEDGDISDEEAVSRIPDRLNELLPGSKKYKIAASSPYRVHERISEKFRVGRVLLAGDAAHVCNPCGGMGLTTGLMDANALMDALGAVINGKADEAVLDFYETERRRVFLEVTSPSATEYKRIISEPDPERRRQDYERFKAVSENPDAMRKTMLALFDTRGQPMLPQ